MSTPPAITVVPTRLSDPNLVWLREDGADIGPQRDPGHPDLTGRANRLDDVHGVKQRCRMAPRPLALAGRALGDDGQRRREHRGREQVPHGRACGALLEERGQAPDVEEVALVGQLVDQLEAALLPLAEVDHPRDQAVGRGGPQTRDVPALRAPLAQQLAGEGLHQRGLAHAVFAHDQHRRQWTLVHQRHQLGEHAL